VLDNVALTLAGRPLTRQRAPTNHPCTVTTDGAEGPTTCAGDCSASEDTIDSAASSTNTSGWHDMDRVFGTYNPPNKPEAVLQPGPQPEHDQLVVRNAMEKFPHGHSATRPPGYSGTQLPDHEQPTRPVS